MSRLVVAPLLVFLAAGASAAEDWRNQAPPVPPPDPPVLPAFQKSILANGLEIYSAQTSDLPVVSFSLVTKGGSAADPADAPGLTSFSYAMLAEGAGALDALAFSDRVADLGANFGAGAGRDSGSISISGLARNAGEMLELVRMAAQSPRLQPQDFERLRAQTLASLTRSRTAPQGIAFSELPALLYGPDHPLGHPPQGTTESVAAFTLDQVKTHFGRMLGPKGSALIAAGALEHEHVVALAEKALGSWAGEARVPEIPPVAPPAARRIVLIDKPGAPQTLIVAGRPLPPKGDPVEVPLAIANEVFGGSFSSRLNLNLREDKGYTYGASSQAIFRRGVGAFVAYAAVRADVSGAALAEMFAEMAQMTSRAPGEDEIRLSKNGVVRTLTGQFQTAGQVSGAAAGLFVQSLPTDYFAQLGPRYDRSPSNQIRSAGTRFIDGERMVVLLVGDAASVQPQVELAGFEDVELRKP
ncbi:MAG: pitrilysin family protein [Myxococcota bacterium]